MIYRVIVRMSYYENWYDFGTMEDAGAFARTILTHAVPNEDMEKKPVYVTINVMKILDPTEVGEKTEGTEE